MPYKLAPQLGHIRVEVRFGRHLWPMATRSERYIVFFFAHHLSKYHRLCSP